MRIGIITQFGSKDNYGQVLQSLALCTMLKNMGHNAFVIQYCPKGILSPRNRIIRCLKSIYKYYKIVTKKGVQYQDYLLDKKNRIREFDVFRGKYLPMSECKYYDLNQLRKNPPAADCYITGSDQVWGQLLNNENNKTFFLDFGGDSVRRISYAASFARNDYPDELKGELKKQLSKFHAISVREPEGVEICKRLGYNQTQLVLDPTLLLTKKDYEQYISAKQHPNTSLFIYCININNGDDIRWNEINEYANQKNLHITVTTATGYLPGYEILEGANYLYATIGEWLGNINNAQYVATTSFHGVVFSIIFNKDFIFIPLKGLHQQGNNRVIRLLEELGITDRILSDGMYIEDILNKPIDWNAVGIRMNSLREHSINYLNKSLSE